MLGTSETRLTSTTNPKHDHEITKASRFQTQGTAKKPTLHPSKEIYQTNDTIFAIFSEFFPEKNMNIPRPTTAFTSPTRSIIHKKRTEWIVPIFAKHFGKEAVT